MIEKLKGSYFAKLVLSHLALTLALVTIGGGLLLNKTAALMTEEMRESGVNQLVQFKERLEREELEKYNALLLGKALSTIRVDAENEIQQLLDGGATNNYYRINRLTQDLKTLSLSLPSLQNLSFYFGRDHFVVDHYFYADASQSPQGKLLADPSGIPLHRWFLRSMPDPEGAIVSGQAGRQTQVLSYVHTLPYMAQRDKIEGYMIIDLDTERMMAALSEHLGANGERLAILDAEGGVIGSSAPWDEAMLALVREHRSGAQDRMIKQSGQVLSILPGGTSIFGWNYALLRPQHSVWLGTQEMKREIWLAALGVLLLGALLSLIGSRGCYRTFRYVSQRIRAAAGQLKVAGAGWHNDVGWIDQALGSLDQQRERYLSDQRERQWRRLAEGADCGGEELLVPDSTVYTAVCVRVHGIDVHAYREQLAAALAEEALRCEHVTLGAQELLLVCLGRLDQAATTRLRRRLDEAIGSGKADAERYDAGVGSAVETIFDLHQSVAEAQLASRYGFLCEDNACMSYEAIEHREGHYPELAAERLETLLRTGETTELAAYMGELERELHSGGYAIEGIELTLMQLHLHLSRTSMMAGGKGSEPPAYRRSVSLRRTIEGLAAIGAEAINRRCEPRSDRYARILGGIRDYVDAHMHEDLSLDQLVELTSYSKQYICKLFKEELQTTFVDYLTTLRLEQAARLLRDTEETVARVAERSGFRSAQYFSNKFKTRYGVTPGQYRKAYGDVQISYS
ncbi:AraC family transcriptional regulator [Paenibacillus sp. IB182496]|uniref:AraC family transcriptional regulator n=1 Tax=Paenibacillus sabuli TaxID=2772509 RepID=A0A927BQS3_9BACL|nr:AraC family transcriptional regulator [Paenibacillus sabuli]MBD2845023.1 AraC family transcriptional regulator [Paenibacillus sabuli]